MNSRDAAPRPPAGAEVPRPGDAQPSTPPFEDIHLTVTVDTLDGEEDTCECHIRRWRSRREAGGLRLFLIPGLAHNSNFFEPLVKTLLDPATGVGGISDIYVADLPGHGGSNLPDRIRFGFLDLGRYARVLRQMLDELGGKDKPPIDLVAGHSMGGMLAMLLEKSLLAEDSSLAKAYATRGVVLLAPAIPEEVPWSLVTGHVERGVYSPGLRLLTPFITMSLRYGVFLYQSNEDYLLNFFAVDGRIAEGAPGTLEASRLNGIESFAAASELAGLDFESGAVLKRPEIPAGIFGPYAFGLVSYSKDFLFKPKEEAALFRHLSGEGRRAVLMPIRNPNAVHNGPYSQPLRTAKIFHEVIAGMEPSAVRVKTRKAARRG